MLIATQRNILEFMVLTERQKCDCEGERNIKNNMDTISKKLHKCFVNLEQVLYFTETFDDFRFGPNLLIQSIRVPDIEAYLTY